MALGTKAGGIYLDLNLNQKGFNTQLNGITKLASKAGKAVAVAFSVKQIVSFSKECIELGSNLEEVQNVVDVAFPTMSKQIDSFAVSAAKNFGLSETMAKRFSGTFGSMATAFGFTESQAASMATTLTGLAGDVASFYNITQDEAYTKLKSVFTGETESLKDLGVVMTQSALDAYALANGFGKTTKSMSEAEKVALRYSFVQDQLTNAAGDFTRTSDSWANQVRVLSLQFDTLKASIGEGLINVLKPVVQWLNLIIEKLIVAAKAFAAFTSAFTENGSESAADKLSGTTSTVSDNLLSASASAKELKRTLAGFDQISKVGEADNSSSGSSDIQGVSTVTNPIGGTFETAEVESAVVATKIADNFKQAVSRIKEGWNEAFNSDDGQKVIDNCGRIAESVKSVWTDPEVSEAMQEFSGQALETLGSLAGNAASVGTSLSIGVSGGIADAKESLEEFDKTKIANITGNVTNLVETVDGLGDTFATIAKAAESEGFQEIVNVLYKIVDMTLLDNLEKATGLLSDLFDFAFKPFIDNADGIKDVLSTSLDILGKLFKPVSKLLDKIAGSSKDYEDSPFHKFFEALTTQKSKSMGDTLDKVNEGLDAILDLLEGNINLNEAFDIIFDLITGKRPGEVKMSVKTSFKGIRENSFNDAKKAYEEIKNNAVVKTISGVATSAFESVKSKWESIKNGEALKTIKGYIANTFNDIKSKWENIKNAEALKTIKGYIANTFNDIRSKWESIKSGEATKTIKGKIGDAFNYIRSQWDAIRDKTVSLSLRFSAAAGDLKNWVNSNIIDKVNGAFDKVAILRNVNIPHLAQGGFVKANTPQLALIGDNKHQGEVVSPEDKLIEMARKAAELAGGNRDAEIVSLLRQILTYLSNMNLTASVDVVALKKLIVRLINEHTQATGVCEIYV